MSSNRKMGKATCGMTGGYESPAYGSWGLGVAGQGVVVLLFSLLLAGDVLPAKGAEKDQLQFADRTTFVAMAVTHAVCFLLVTALSLLGYLFSSCFLCPLGLLSIGVQVALLTTCGVCGSLLTASVNFGDSVLTAVRNNGVLLPTLSQIFVYEHEGKLLLICTLCLTAVVSFSKGVSLDTGAPAHEAILYTLSLTLMVASASVFLFIRAVPGLAGLATAWICVALAVGIAMVIQKCFCSRVLAIGVSVVFLCSAIFGIVSCSAIGALFMRGKVVYTSVNLAGASTSVAEAISQLTDKQFESYRAFVLANNGAYLIAGICFNIATVVYTAMACLNTLRTACSCKSRPEKNDDDKSSA